MSPREKRTIAIVGAIVLFWAASIAAVAVVVLRAGMITVQVRDDSPCGENISLRLPGALVVAALHFVPDGALAGAADRAPQWAPMVRALSRSLKRCPDCVLVSVDSPTDVVRIAKRGRHLMVDVRDADERVHLAIPFGVVGPILRRFERISGGKPI